MRWRAIKLECLACLTLQPERADAEQVSTLVAPLPLEGPVQGKAAADSVEPAGKLARKQDPLGSTAINDSRGQLVILYSGHPAFGAAAREVADFVHGEALAHGLAPAPPAPLETPPPLPPCGAVVIVCATGPGLDAERSAAPWLDASPGALAGAGPVKGLSFVLLGLGDSASAGMQLPRALRQRLLASGGVELVPMAECAEAEMGEVLEPWAASLWQPLQKVVQPPEQDGIKAVTAGLYQQLGGAAAVAAIFEAWCRKAQADWRVRRFLEGSQDESVRASMGQWLASVLGGPLPYRGPDPGALYSRLVQEKGLNGTHLDTLAQHLAGSMAELGISTQAIDGALAAVAYHRQLLAKANTQTV